MRPVGLGRLVCLCACLALAATAAPAQATEFTTLIRCVNDLRVAHGLKRLTVTTRLDRGAYRHARVMRWHFGHTDPFTGLGPLERIKRISRFDYVGENIAAGHANAWAACKGLRASPGHRRNMLDPRFTNIGAGVAYGGRRHTYYVQDFAAR